ncbi:MAG: hypothetical protein ABI759_14835 [Candidatus Solibacter sp.]
MSPDNQALGDAVLNLPPLILHPFNEQIAPSSLLESSKAALMLSGLIPSEGSEPDELKRRLLVGRYCELRMLFFLGKDIFRWIDQCQDWAQRVPELGSWEIRAQSFARLLTKEPPEAIRQKLISWGVADYVSIFSRGIGLNAVFAEPPGLTMLNESFLRNYHRYPDFLFRCFMESEPFQALPAANFRFDLYASGEYSRMLESQWAE